MKTISIEVIEAASRLLDPKVNAYPGLKLTGSKESAEKFYDDVTLVAEAIGKLVCPDIGA